MQRFNAQMQGTDALHRCDAQIVRTDALYRCIVQMQSSNTMHSCSAKIQYTNAMYRFNAEALQKIFLTNFLAVSSNFGQLWSFFNLQIFRPNNIWNS